MAKCGCRLSVGDAYGEMATAYIQSTSLENELMHSKTFQKMVDMLVHKG